MDRILWIRLRTVVLSLVVLFGGLPGAVAPLHAGGAVHYQAGNLAGSPAQTTPERGMWEDRDGTHYRSAPPEESWKTPWLEEQKQEDRSWNMLNNMILDLSPYRKRPKQAIPQSSTQPK